MLRPSRPPTGQLHWIAHLPPHILRRGHWSTMCGTAHTACHSLLRAPTVRRVAWQFEAAYTIALKPKRWRFGRRSGGERIAAFAMKHIQPFRSRLLDTVPIHYFLAFRAIGVRNYR